MRRSIKKFFTISTIAFVILYPCLFMYFQNADEAKLIDALPAFEKFLALRTKDGDGIMEAEF
jgi:hypothetical protein